MSEKPGGGATSDRAATRLDACANTVCNSGSYAEPGQFVAVPAPTAPTGPFTLPRIGGVKGEVPTLYFSSTCSACSRSAGVKSITSSGTFRNCREYAGGLVGNGCVGDVFSPGTVDCSTGRSSIGHTGWPVTRSKTYSQPILCGNATAL